MKLLARILSHGFAIAVVLLLAIGLIYRGKLFPEYDLPGYLDIGKLAEHREESTAAQVPQDAAETDAGIDTAEVETSASAPEPAPAESEVAPQVPAVIAPEVTPEAAAEVTPEAAAEVTPEAAAEAPEEESAPDYMVQGPGEVGQQREEEAPENVPSLTEESVPTAVPDVTAPGAVPEDNSGGTDAIATVPESETVIAEATETKAPHAKPQPKAYQLLADAREAYWLRDYDIAESKYRDLTRVDPDNPDGYGELGNMYFSQGQWEEAASAYYEAGVRLIRQGLLDQAEELVAVIRGLNDGHADDLEQKIKEARSAAD